MKITIKSLRDKQKELPETAEKFFQKPKNEIEELAQQPHKSKKVKSIFGMLFFVIFVMLFGGIGAILIDRMILPSMLIKYPELNQYEFFKIVNESTTVVEITKEVKISSDEAIIEAIKKVSPSVVQILEFSNGGKDIAHKGAGTVLTSDGLIITSINNITVKKPATSEEGSHVIKVKLENGEVYEMRLIEIDLATELAIIKIEKTNLPVIALAYYKNIELGERLVIMGDSVAIDIVSKFIEDYVSESEQKKAVETGKKATGQRRVKIANNLAESFSGSPVINLKGEILGISYGGDLFMPVNSIQSFIETTMNKLK
jgi:S1-C subfamily serine protease